jgi:hypothetical protein
VKALSDSLAELSQRAKAAEDHTAAAVKETGEQIDARIADVKANALGMRKDLRSRRAQAEGDVAARWMTVRAGVHEQFDQMRTDRDERRGERDAKVAERRANRAEADAAEAIDFAAYTIEEAEASVLEAAEARAIADGLTSNR